MDHFSIKFWLLCIFAAVICLVVGAMAASAQAVPPPENELLLKGFLGCGNPGAEPTVCPSGIHYVKLTEGKMYAIRLASSDFNSKLVLEDMFGNELACDMDYFDDMPGMIAFRPIASGEYRLVVSTKNLVEGYYTISVREMPALLNVTGELTRNHRLVHDAYVSVHEVKLEAGRRYVIDLHSGTFDTFLKLLNPQGAIVAFADEGGTMGNRRVVFTPLRTEVYRIVATSYEPAAVGPFDLVVCAD